MTTKRMELNKNLSLVGKFDQKDWEEGTFWAHATFEYKKQRYEIRIKISGHAKADKDFKSNRWQYAPAVYEGWHRWELYPWTDENQKIKNEIEKQAMSSKKFTEFFIKYLHTYIKKTDFKLDEQGILSSRPLRDGLFDVIKQLEGTEKWKGYIRNIVNALWELNPHNPEDEKIIFDLHRNLNLVHKK